MSTLNDTAIVKQQYATAKNLNTRISIHDKYSTNKMGFGNWIVSNYRVEKGMKVLELGCGTSMTSLSRIPKREIKDILMKYTINGVLNVPKEYGMFIAL